jgi:hypothetical protein
MTMHVCNLQVAAERPDCLQEGLSLGFAAGCTGILPGFFRAHDQLKVRASSP